MSVDVADFQAEVIERSRSVPVLVDFWAGWCAPCRVLGPVLERLAEEAQGRWALAKVDVERFPEQASAYGVMGIPAVKLFVDGEVRDEFVGALPESEVRRWLAAAIPSPRAGRVAAARAQLERGDLAAAAALLREVVDAEPANAEARMALAEALLHVDPARVEEALAPVGEPEWLDRAEALRTLAAVAGEADREDAGASEAERSFAAAARALRRREFDAALEAFIDVLRRDRSFGAGRAREAARAIFVLLGIEHPIAERWHRAFSSALHV